MSLIDAEWRVLNLLVEATRAFMSLPEHHPSDKQEWAFEVHHLQQRVMSRAAVREYPDVFVRMAGMGEEPSC